MDEIKSIRECNCQSGINDVVDVKLSHFWFIEELGIFTRALVIILVIITAGIWLVVVFIYKFNAISKPKILCINCGRLMNENQFRL